MQIQFMVQPNAGTTSQQSSVWLASIAGCLHWLVALAGTVHMLLLTTVLSGELLLLGNLDSGYGYGYGLMVRICLIYLV